MKYFKCNLCKDKNIEEFGCILIVPDEVSKPNSCPYFRDTEENNPDWRETNYTILEDKNEM